MENGSLHHLDRVEKTRISQLLLEHTKRELLPQCFNRCYSCIFFFFFVKTSLRLIKVDKVLVCFKFEFLSQYVAIACFIQRPILENVFNNHKTHGPKFCVALSFGERWKLEVNVENPITKRYIFI